MVMSTGPKAIEGKGVCMFHGSKSKGPITFSGKQRCAAAKTIHGRETWSIRNKRAQKLAEMKFYFRMLNV